MTVNFFSDGYQSEPPRTDKKFGINDSDTKAYTTNSGQEKLWNAIVLNSQTAEIQFVAIDNNIIIKDSVGNIQSQCDGMLYTENKWLSFVELKDIDKRSWITPAVNQLQSTINFFKSNHDYKQFKHRFAYVCNKQHPKFQFSKKELMLNFFQTTQFRLRIQKEITVE